MAVAVTTRRLRRLRGEDALGQGIGGVAVQLVLAQDEQGGADVVVAERVLQGEAGELDQLGHGVGRRQGQEILVGCDQRAKAGLRQQRVDGGLVGALGGGDLPWREPAGEALRHTHPVAPGMRIARPPAGGDGGEEVHGVPRQRVGSERHARSI